MKGRPLNDRGLAQRLRPYEVKPKVLSGGAQRGYLCADFYDAWKKSTFHPCHPQFTDNVTDDGSVTCASVTPLFVTDTLTPDVTNLAPKPPNPNEINNVTDVTLVTRLAAGGRGFVCAQCGAGPATDPPGDAPTVPVTNGNADVWVRFVPNITFGPMVIEAVRRHTRKPLNVHLMIVEPERYLDAFAKAGADHLLVQAEPSATIHLHRVLSQIRDLGKQAGVALDPASPIELIEYVLHLCDVVLVMTVNPGFSGQKFLPEMLPKIRRLRQLCDTRGLNPVIEVDGGENRESARQAIEAGANAIVAGSAIFGSDDYATAIAAIREAQCPLTGSAADD